MTRWTFTIREVGSRPGRAILTLLSVVLGVAAVVAITTASGATRRAYDDMYRSMAGRASLEVVNAGGGAYDEEIAATISALPGVEAAVPVLQRPTIIYLPEIDDPGQIRERIQVTLLGIDPDKDPSVRDYALAAGEFFREGAGVLLDADFAAHIGVRVGDTIKLPVGKQKRLAEAEVVGLLSPKGAATFSQGGTLFLSLKVGQKLMGVGPKIDATHVVLEKGVKEEAVRAELVRTLPQGMRVQRPAARTELADKTLLQSEQGLHLATALSLVIALFIIFNTFLMNVSERRRQLSIMRAIGATRSQVSGMMLSEGLMLGVLGTALGIGLGVFGAQYVTDAMGALMNSQLPRPGIALWPCVLGTVFGLVVSLAGVYFPARKASSVSPLEGMGGSYSEDREGPHWLMTTVGILLAVTTTVMLVLTILGRLPPIMAPGVAAIFMVGLVMLAPLALPGLSRLLTPMLSPFLHYEGRLARLQLLRRRLRTGLTIGVLFVAIGTGIGTSNATFDNIQDIHRWYTKTFIGDFFVRAMLPDFSSGGTADMPLEVGEEIRAIDGVEHVDTLILVRVEVLGEAAMVIASGFGSDQPLKLDLLDAEPEETIRRMSAGEMVVSSVLSERLKLKPGDELEIPTPQGPRVFRIAALSNEYAFGGVVLHLNEAVARQAFEVEGAHAFAVSADPVRRKEVEEKVAAICDERGLMLQTNLAVKRMVDGMINGVTGSLYVLLVLGFVVAAFGIVNTLTMNVLEQTREIGLLRTVAMTRRQVRKLIISQAVIMGVVGLLPGAIAGIGISYLMNLCTPAVVGHHVQFALRPSLLVGSFLSALVIVTAAALLPAERAARLDLRTAMQSE